MHGLLIRDKKELSEQEKAADILAGESAMSKLTDLINLKKSRNFSTDSFALTLELLKLNPELSLAWNFRREIILSSPFVSLPEELALLNSVMVDMQMTKSYCLWNHRRWVLLELKRRDQVDDPTLRSEMSIVETIHSLDSRNFHAWSYRKFMTDNFHDQVQVDNIQYSTKLIEADFSCYSAWFLRTTQVDDLNPVEELDLVWNAIFTEPNDQSAWQYHDWLVNRFESALRLKDEEYLAELESVIEVKDSKYVLIHKLKKSEGEEREQIRQLLCQIDPLRRGYYNSE